MARRRTTVYELSAAELNAIMAHPEQQANINVVENLLLELDTAGIRPDRLRDVQESLYRVVYRVQQYEHDLRRSLKRVQSGKNPGWPVRHEPDLLLAIAPPWRIQCPLGSQDESSWDLELLVAERVERQLKSVGDVLAWRVYRYDRRSIIALSRNPPPGPFAGKPGVRAERTFIAELWEREKRFSLMHDLTSALRIVDITELYADGSHELHEVKTSESASTHKQRALAQAALRAIDGVAPLPTKDPSVQTYLWQSSVQLRTHVRRLESLIDQASRDGFWIGRVDDRIACVVNLLSANEHGKDFVEWWKNFTDRRNFALQKMLPASKDHLKAVSADLAGRDAALAPFGIFPLPAIQRAYLICDYVIIETVMAVESLINALESHGLAARSLLPASNGARSNWDRVIEAAKGERMVILHGTAISQLLLEFNHTGAYGRATAELMDASNPSVQGVLAFSNERAQWR